MVVKAIARNSVARNGFGAFVQPCNKIKIQYCNWGGSSQGMRKFLEQRLSKYASSNGKIQFEVVKKSGHPVVTGYYGNGREKAVCVANLNIDNIENKLNVVRNASGEQLRDYKQKVESLNKSVRGTWSPFHVDPSVRHRV